LWKNKLTFMLIPDSKGISKQISVRLALIWGVAAAVLGMLIANFFLSAQFFSDRVTELEMSGLKTENIELAEKYQQLRQDMGEVETRLKGLIDKEITLRTAFNLPEISTAERQLGVGGPASPAVATMTNSERVAHQTEIEVDRLLRLAKYEQGKYSEVENALFSLKDRLDHTPSIWPTRGWKSRGFGREFDPFTGLEQMHRGIDIANHIGTPVVAPADGLATVVAVAGKFGKMIEIDHGYGLETHYAHLSQTNIRPGQRVKRGDIIGLMGNTGYSTGPHLHYEVLRNGMYVNPNEYILNDM
jgi:murein DD-endopeptidase MepM/ murein hydrolase activator NlpD